MGWQRVRDGFRGLLASGIELTAAEQRALLIVLALFILGVATRGWHLTREPAPGAPAAASQRNAPSDFR